MDGGRNPPRQYQLCFDQIVPLCLKKNTLKPLYGPSKDKVKLPLGPPTKSQGRRAPILLVTYIFYDGNEEITLRQIFGKMMIV